MRIAAGARSAVFDLLVKHCSPTLAGLKTGGLFACDAADWRKLWDAISLCNRTLSKKGLRVLPMRCREGRALVYAYRPAHLARDLENCIAKRILEGRGYSLDSPCKCVAELVKRCRTCEEFPHEIGLFLGYPPEDVDGFIENRAACHKCAGLWRVYGDLERAQCLFQKYKKCSAVYRAQWQRGVGIERLTVKCR